MRKSHLFSPPTLLIAVALCLCFRSEHTAAQQAAIADSGIVVHTNYDGASAAKEKAPITTYDKILAHPSVLTNNGKRVVGFDISFQPKEKDYYGPFKITGNKFTGQVLDVIKKIRDAQVPATTMFIENIEIRDGNSVKQIGSRFVKMMP